MDARIDHVVDARDNRPAFGITYRRWTDTASSHVRIQADDRVHAEQALAQYIGNARYSVLSIRQEDRSVPVVTPQREAVVLSRATGPGGWGEPPAGRDHERFTRLANADERDAVVARANALYAKIPSAVRCWTQALDEAWGSTQIVNSAYAAPAPAPAPRNEEQRTPGYVGYVRTPLQEEEIEAFLVAGNRVVTAHLSPDQTASVGDWCKVLSTGTSEVYPGRVVETGPDRIRVRIA